MSYAATKITQVPRFQFGPNRVQIEMREFVKGAEAAFCPPYPLAFLPIKSRFHDARSFFTFG